MNAEDIEVAEIEQILQDHTLPGPLHKKRELIAARHRREIIVRYFETEHAFYVVSVSARRR